MASERASHWALCPLCGHERPVDRDGRLRWHRRYLGFWRGERAEEMVHCAGSGEWPATDPQPAEAAG